jgi:hypothetical protein
MRRGCLIGSVGTLALCLVVCGLGYFVAIPRVRDTVRDGMRDALSTQVAIQIPAGVDGSAEPGEYTITAADLQDQFVANTEDGSVQDVFVRISPSGIEIGLTASADQEAVYSGFPLAEDGDLVMSNMTTNNEVLDFILPADDLGTAIEDAVNNYLAESGLVLDSLKLSEGELTLETSAAP